MWDEEFSPRDLLYHIIPVANNTVLYNLKFNAQADPIGSALTTHKKVNWFVLIL